MSLRLREPKRAALGESWWDRREAWKGVWERLCGLQKFAFSLRCRGASPRASVWTLGFRLKRWLFAVSSSGKRSCPYPPLPSGGLWAEGLPLLPKTGVAVNTEGSEGGHCAGASGAGRKALDSAPRTRELGSWTGRVVSTEMETEWQNSRN